MNYSSEKWVWSLYSYIDHRRRSAVQDWYDCQSDKVRAEFDTAFRYLRVGKDTDWVMPRARAFRGTCKGLKVGRFKVDGKIYTGILF